MNELLKTVWLSKYEVISIVAPDPVSVASRIMKSVMGICKSSVIHDERIPDLLKDWEL